MFVTSKNETTCTKKFRSRSLANKFLLLIFQVSTLPLPASSKNKIQGTLILKLANVKRIQVKKFLKKIRQKKSSKKSVEKKS